MTTQIAKFLLALLILIAVPCSAQSFPATDSFSGSGALSSNWSNTTVGTGLTYPPVALAQASGKVVPSTSGQWGFEVYTGVTFTNDQYSQAKFVTHSTAGGGTGPCVRMNVDGNAYCYAADDGTLMIWSNGVWNTTLITSCPIPSTGDTIQISAVGTLITCKDVTTGVSSSTTDTTYWLAAGIPGVVVDQRYSTVYALSTFQADCVPTCATGTVATPTFSPVAGTYSSTQTVTISTTTTGATIHYTTDGSTPTASSATYSSAISVAVTETVKAIAVKAGYTNSAVGSATYTLTAATPTFSPAAGSYANTQTVTITSTTSGTTIHYTTDGTTPTASSATYSSAISVAVSETVKAIAIKTGYTNSAVGSATYTLTVATPTFSPAAGGYTVAQTVTISTSTSGATIHYTTDGTTPTASSATYSSAISVAISETVKAIAVKTGYTNSAVGSAAYTLTAVTPTFSPAAGSYTSIQTVTISSTTSGAVIHYTTDGTTPTASSTAYSSPITVSTTETVKALAVKTGWTNSAVGSAAYTITLTAATPTFSPVAGSYTSVQTVTISSATSGATIHYTTDGSTPTASSTTYSTAISVGVTETVKAIAVKTGYTNSAVGSAAYVITLGGLYPVTDAFTGSGALSASWTNTTAGSGLSYPPVTLVRSTNKVVPTTTGWGEAVYTGLSFTSDQYAQTVFVSHNTASGWTGPCVRVAVNGNGYCYVADSGDIVLFNAGIWDGTISTGCPIPASGDTIKLSAVGSTITCTDVTTGVSAFGTDSTYWVGQDPGLMVDTRGAATYALTSFKADCIPTCVITATPTFSPGAGSYSTPQAVTISTTSTGAAIYYTTDGTTPTTSSAGYFSPVTISYSDTLKAVALASGDVLSSVGSASYILPVATPTLSPAGGSYNSAQSVTISDLTPGSTIYYTTNGSTPTTSSTLYSGPIGVSSTQTIKALAVLSGSPNSPVASASYTIQVAKPIFSPVAGAYASTQTVTISDASTGATIHYTTDGSTPTSGSPTYSSAITVSTSKTIKAIGILSGFDNSVVASALYTIGKTVTAIEISPWGAALQTGASTQFSVTCTYSDHSTDDCTQAGGAAWSSSANLGEMSVSSTGLATWLTDPGVGGYGGYYVLVAAGGFTDKASVFGQHPGDTWYQYPTPGYTGNAVVGSTVTAGSGFSINQTSGGSFDGNGAPIQGICTWSSSDPTKATVDRNGQIKAIAAGTVTITCGRTGNAVFGTSTSSGWVAPGNVLSLNVVATGPVNNPHGTQTWYVRPDGGTPYTTSSATPYGQCNGLSNTAYPGTTGARWIPAHVYATGTVITDLLGHYETATTGGTSSPGTVPPFTGSTTTDGSVTWTKGGTYPVNQSCAMGNIRYLWSDENTYEQLQWMINGGDTVIVAQNSAGYNTGLDVANPLANSPGTPGSSWYPFTCNSNSGCSMPNIPSGTASQHTKILGANYASCHADSAKTLLHVSYGGSAGLAVSGSQFVDVACFEITDQAACAWDGNYANSCYQTALNFGNHGIVEDALSSNDTYTDIFIHGLAGDGIRGATGVGIVADHIHIRAMPDSGVNMDDSPWNMSNISVAGGFTMTNSITEWSGCVEEYPITHTYPLLECRDQNTGSYADGFGTASTTGDWYFDHDTWQYNFQDGLDLLHSGMQNFTVINSLSQANEGQSFKIGSGDHTVFQNNIAMGNCFRIGNLIGDEPASALTPGGGPPGTGYSLCRAVANVSVHMSDQGTYAIQNNTIITTNSADTPFTLACDGGWDYCYNAVALYQNNVMLNYGDNLSPNSSYDGHGLPANFYLLSPNPDGQTESSDMPFLNGWSSRTNNNYFNMRYCPTQTGTLEVCNTSDPLLTGEAAVSGSHTIPILITAESQLDNFNVTPATGSPLIGAGTPITNQYQNGVLVIPAITTDYNGNPRPNPPAIGAVEP